MQRPLPAFPMVVILHCVEDDGLFQRETSTDGPETGASEGEGSMQQRTISGAAGTWKTSSSRSVREDVDTGWDTFRDRARDVLEPVFGFVARLVRIARWVLTRVALLYPVRWLGWQTAADERTCVECGVLDGQSWPEDRSGPMPPLHVNCRCRVVPVRTEWRVRYVPQWQQYWTTQQAWEWRRTGWA